MGKGGPFSVVKTRTWRDAVCSSQLVPRQRIVRAIFLLPFVACMAVAGQLYVAYAFVITYIQGVAGIIDTFKNSI
jgi:hypothetical protein